MSDADRDNILAGIYRQTRALCAGIERLTALLARFGASAPVPPVRDALAPTLPGLPDEDWTPPDMTPPPRVWGNTVRFWGALWDTFHGARFRLDDLVGVAALKEATGGKIALATYPRILSALVKAGAADRTREGYAVREPTDALREAVEAARKGGEK